MGEIFQRGIKKLRRNLAPLSHFNFEGVFVPEIQHEHLPQLKIAFVKQEVCPDLYCCPPKSSAQKIVLSTLLRTGMAALFSAHNTDFWIIKEMEADECRLWQEKINYCGIDENKIRMLTNSLPSPNLANHKIPQGKHAIDPGIIDWSFYDIVISMDIAIPKYITTQHKKVLWCYYIQEHCMPSYSLSSQRPIDGYDIFLNQRFRYSPFLSFPKKHEIDFPYYLQYNGCFNQLLDCDTINVKQRTGILICKHSYKILTDEEKITLANLGHPIYFQEGSTEELLSKLLQSKYYLKIGGLKRWGNAMIESISCSCLFLGNPDEFYNKSLFTKETVVTSFQQLIEKIKNFDSNHEIYENALEKQVKLVNYLAYFRPIKQLLKKMKWKLANQDV